MDRLAIGHHFEDVFDIIAAELEPSLCRRPMTAFSRAINVDPKKAAMFEDLARNLSCRTHSA